MHYTSMKKKDRLPLSGNRHSRVPLLSCDPEDLILDSKLPSVQSFGKPALAEFQIDTDERLAIGLCIPIGAHPPAIFAEPVERVWYLRPKHLEPVVIS